MRGGEGVDGSREGEGVKNLEKRTNERWNNVLVV